MTTNEVDGHVGNLFQARVISGGVTFANSAHQENAVPRQLKADVSKLVGRASEVSRLLEMLKPGDCRVRVLAIVGTAGVGKTSLALHLAHRLHQHFPDGQLFAELHGFDTGPHVSASAALEKFLRAMGCPPEAIPADQDERAALYRTELADRRILVLLDDAVTFQHIEPLLPAGPGNLVIVTSRNRLPGLSHHGAYRQTLGLLAPEDATTLITTITRGYRPVDPPDDVAELAKLCAHLPLALRIVAERAAYRPSMPLIELIEDLRGETSLWHILTPNPQDDTEAVKAVFDSSYNSLPDPVARAFRLLALHPGAEMTAEAACALLHRPLGQARALLDALSASHLIEQTGPNHYQFHSLLRAYAAHQADADEKPAARAAAIERIVLWHLHGADAAARATQTLFPSLLTDPAPSHLHSPQFADADQAREWFMDHRATLLAVLHAALDANLTTLTWQLSWTLRPLYTATSSVDDWLAAATMGLEAARRQADPGVLARMLAQMAGAHRSAGALEAAADHYHQALDLYQANHNAPGIVETANSLGLIHFEQRELDQAQAQFDLVHQLATITMQLTWAAIAQDNLAATYVEAGRIDLATTCATEAFDRYMEQHVDARIALVPLLHLARIHRENGEYSLAEERIEQAEQMLAGAGMYIGIECDVLLERAAVDLAQGRHEQATTAYLQCIDRQRPLGPRTREATALVGLGRVASVTGHHEQAANYFAQGIAIQRESPDNYELASTLAEYADSLERQEDLETANDARGEAIALLVSYPDIRASKLQEALIHSRG